MKPITILESAPRKTMEPICPEIRLSECPVAGSTLRKILGMRVSSYQIRSPFMPVVYDCFWPSQQILESMYHTVKPLMVLSRGGEVLAWMSENGKIPDDALRIEIDDKSLEIRYPWNLLSINEEIVGAISENIIFGEVRHGVNIDGKVHIGRGTVLLPGTYIEGNVVVGENCKIGPNCYIRGSTAIGSHCHIGQAVEIKNSIIMDRVSVGHLSYVGDSIVGHRTNFGAGTITANLRHDGKTQKSSAEGTLVDTGRRKLGVITGQNVHTGIHTSIYPGRKIWSNKSTRPGEVVQKDIA